MKRVPEIAGVVIICIVAIFLFGRMKSEENKLSKSGVYVVGKLIKSSFGADHGWVYEYEFIFNRKRYVKSFTGPLRDQIAANDSLLFFRIFPANPKICRQVLDFEVANCYRKLDLKNSYWKKLPGCSD